MRIEHLFVIAFLAGIGTNFYNVAQSSFVPILVGRPQLVEANSKLQVSYSATQIVGPSAGGALVQAFTGPLVVLVDAISFLASAILLWVGVRVAEPENASHARRSLWVEIREGLEWVMRDKLLRVFAVTTALLSFFTEMMMVLFAIYAVRELGLRPALLGLTLTGIGPGALLGATLAGRISRRYGLGLTVIAAAALGTLAQAVVPLAYGEPEVLVPLLFVGQFLFGVATVIYVVNQVSLRQAITPDRLQGRVGASQQLLNGAALPLGSAVGGILGEALGLRTTLAIAVVGLLSGPVLLLFSPVRTLREPPTTPAQEST
ncbi:MAG: MFS transporter [Chloroflexota bacterium]|nr:MAG: MFS transporter [Chloroflexota bacterium]